MQNLYHDNAFVKSAWYSNDIITLFVVVPLLVVAIYFTQKGSQRWLLVLMGLMGYVFYNFSFYLFGAAFNVFFLIYAMLVSMSAITLIVQLSNIRGRKLITIFSKKAPSKAVSIYLIFIALLLFSLELSMIIPFLTSGRIPDTIKLTGLTTSVVFALDFSIVIPASTIAAVMLWQRHAWGFVLGVIMLVKSFTYGLVLCVGTTIRACSTSYGKWDPLMPMYVLLVIGGLSGCWMLLKNGMDSKTTNLDNENSTQ